MILLIFLPKQTTAMEVIQLLLQTVHFLEKAPFHNWSYIIFVLLNVAGAFTNQNFLLDSMGNVCMLFPIILCGEFLVTARVG